MLTINALAEKTGISSYEIRRRVHAGMQHVRVGAKRTKILIDEDVFDRMLAEESINNATVKVAAIDEGNSDDAVGYGKLRKIE